MEEAVMYFIFIHWGYVKTALVSETEESKN
jgi:hypothetical protein